METHSLGRESGCSKLFSPCLCGLGSLETWSGLEFLSLDSDTFEEVVGNMAHAFHYSEKAMKAIDNIYFNSLLLPLRVALFFKRLYS